jgi:ribosomal protein S18 acetylase RimI-like enzyme
LEIRVLNQDDAEAFRELRLAAMKERPTAFTADYQTNLQRPLSHFAAQIHSLPDSFILGAFQNDTLVGIVGFFRSEGPKVRHNGNIWTMYVGPELRGQGVGRRLLLDAVERARSVSGLLQILLSVVADNVAARTLYLSAGFQITGREPRTVQVDGRFYDEDRMVLSLGKDFDQRFA